MGSLALARFCCLATLLAVTVARPSAEISRDARGQTILDSSDPSDKPRSIDMGLEHAYKGGIIPVALLYEEPEKEDNAKRPLRETEDSDGISGREEPDVEEKDDEVKEETQDKEDYGTTETSETEAANFPEAKGINKNSKLLDIEERENDENAKYGLEIQSRNKVPTDEESDELEKPFVYNIQPLSYFSSESNTKEEENIINYINKIKEIRENQIKIEAGKKEEKKPVVQKTEEAVVTEAESDEGRPIRRKIQHYETVIKPMMMESAQAYGGMSQAYGGLPQVYGGVPQGYSVYPASTTGYYPPLYQQGYPPNPYQQSPIPQSPTVVYLPNPFKSSSSTSNAKSGNNRLFDDYFPILINNPFNEIWAGITNIVEYGPEADVCRKNKRGRISDEETDEVSEDEVTTEIELPEQRIGLLGNKGESWPKFTRLKVRRGGVAIAGPGGIATAGSGGTAIVGPGGTAYTTREGTAVVGPGGRVVRVPQFPIYAKDIPTDDEPREFIPPMGSETVAHGPVVYYDNPLDRSEMPDPVFPSEV